MFEWLSNITHWILSQMNEGHETRTWLTKLVVSEPINGVESRHFGSVDVTTMCRCGHVRTHRYKTSLFGSASYARIACADLASRIKIVRGLDGVAILDIDEAASQLNADKQRLDSAPVAETRNAN
jgi:hypothetical protein